MATLFDQAQRICRGDSLPPPVARLIGFTLTAIVPGQARIAFEAGAQHANPMGTLHGGKLQAIGRVVKHGRTVGLVECDILDADETLVARATSTCMTLRGEQGRGR